MLGVEAWEVESMGEEESVVGEFVAGEVVVERTEVEESVVERKEAEECVVEEVVVGKIGIEAVVERIGGEESVAALLVKATHEVAVCQSSLVVAEKDKMKTVYKNEYFKRSN